MLANASDHRVFWHLMNTGTARKHIFASLTSPVRALVGMGASSRLRGSWPSIMLRSSYNMSL